ncbi:MAG: c-type cytochrome [Azonexaceae bacterium]|uniref:c-type cytochrome n=1 Tax=Azonexus sp. R2A61 TaxID=2744443 RepID=UPI001F412C0C|nr:c-type cytochrome [Azonexus sp. R2A61]MCE1240471.1 c-type cytochrome [Azonexaceae bacterium]
MKSLFAFAGLSVACLVHAAPPTDAERTVGYYAANCFNCHGTEGKAVSAIPAIAGRDRQYLEETLKAFKAGTKSATIMHQLAKGYTDEELAALADYFSRRQ